MYFDPENIVKLAIEGGCNAVASTLGVLGICRAQVRAQDSVHREDQSQRVPDAIRTSYDQIMFAQVKQACDMGAVAVGATIYFGSRRVDPPDSGSLARRSSRPTSWAW